MSQSLVKNIIHLIYSVKDRAPLVPDTIRGELHAYTIGILRNYDCKSIQVNSVTDHVHYLFALSAKHALSEIVEEVKKATSKWIKTKGPLLANFYWQPGYAAFSVSEDQIETVKAYIQQQTEHHKVISFQDELREILRREGIAFDERYLWS